MKRYLSYWWCPECKLVVSVYSKMKCDAVTCPECAHQLEVTTNRRESHIDITLEINEAVQSGGTA
jgi:uncharacterized paraquat-inducible protein A